MKPLLLLLAAAALAAPAPAQTALTTGHIQYEVAQKIDLSQVRIMINGQQVKPGSPDFPADIPDTRTFGLTLAFAGGYAREERENTAMRVVMDGTGPRGGLGGPGGGGVPQTTRLTAPFQEVTYVNLADRAYAATLTVTTAGQATTYRADQPFPTTEGWQETGQTRKIAGYACRKATAPYQGETYTIWYTQELPFTYSPVKELLPQKGVVLALEGEKEQYRATKVDGKPVAEADVKPTAGAQAVTPAELKDLREKAAADFRQQLLEEGPGRLDRE